MDEKALFRPNGAGHVHILGRASLFPGNMPLNHAGFAVEVLLATLPYKSFWTTFTPPIGIDIDRVKVIRDLIIIREELWVHFK
jgi:hypothetical protein